MPAKKKKQKQSGTGLYDKIANNVFGANLGLDEIHAPQWTNSGFHF
jgi:hypothetical protein